MTAALAEQWPLLIGWAAYALVHSALAANAARQALMRRLNMTGSAYRRLYNLLALLLLLPLLVMVYANPGPLLWDPGSGARLALDGLALAVLAALLLAGPAYDLREFLGLSAAASAGLRLSPWHRWVRHPWYFAALVLVWTREMSAAWLVSASCITAYFVVGSRLEERKLIATFGEAYAAYRRRVPGLLPWRGQALSAAEAAALSAQANAAAGRPPAAQSSLSDSV
jgi:protein-S-isoprenylcysteine O-methyltransferase Ste14